MAERAGIRPIALMGYAIILLTFGVFGGWAAVARLDSAVVAMGTISLEGNRKVIQHLEGGIVDEILVREAEHVEAGDVVLRLNSVEARSNLEVLRNRLLLARILEARLLAERSVAAEIDFSGVQSSVEGSSLLQSALSDQQMQFQDRRSILKSQTDIFESRVEQTSEQIEGLELQRSALERRFRNYQDMITRMEEGLKKGLIQANLLSQRQDEFIRIEADLGRVISEIAQAKNLISETKLQALQATQQYRERANTELDEARTQITELDERVKVAQDVLERTAILAPVSGAIQNLKVHTLGSVVRPGDVLMELVPQDEQLVIDARVTPLDVDNVAPGMKTEVRFTAFKARLTPIVLGEVKSVSSDVITPDNPSEMPYYLARVHVKDEDIEPTIRQRLTPGMPADVVVTSGERTVINYLTSPLMDAVRKSLLEE